MSKLGIVAITAAICLPLGALAADMMLAGHPHLQAAHHAMHEALHEITESQKANEKVWGDEGGHGKEAKALIEKAAHELDLAAEWVNAHHK